MKKSTSLPESCSSTIRMTESEPPPPPAPPPPNDGFPSSLFSSLLEEEEESHEGLIGWYQMEDTHHQHINWKQRYEQMKVTFTRFRMETAELQQSLQEKLTELEQKVTSAERREEEARQKIQLLEQRLQGIGVTGDSYKDCIANSDQACKAQLISNLEQQVEEQKKLRILDAKKVEAKASKIKEWVTNKLKELEEQNYTLREENKKCNSQLELLKKRLSQMSQQKEKNNTEDSSRGSWEDQGSSDDAPPLSSISSANQRANYINNNEPSYNSSMPVVDGNKKSSSWVSAQQARVDQWIDSSCQVSLTRRPDSEEADNLQAMGSDTLVEAGLPPMVPPHSVAISSPFSQTSSSRTVSDSKKPLPKKQHSRSLPRETTRNSSMQVTNIPSSTSRTTTTQTNIENELNSSNKTSANNGTSSYGNIYGSLDRKLKMLNVGNGYAGGERRRTVQTSNDLHDYAEIYTPSKEIIGGLDPDVDIRPPTPPLHRFPSWESRIYEVAVNGISLSRDELHTCPIIPSHKPKKASESFMTDSFTDMSIPVYAMVKGRASQIRSVPFTGESTDSSDNEDNTRVTSTHTTSGETESSASTGSPGRNKGSSNQSPAKHSCTSPTKSVKRDTSTESVLSDDYAIPPDAYADTYSIDSVEQPRLSSAISETLKKDNFEKCGYLTKLGGKLKTWRRRWFVLKNGTLSYYKTQNDVGRKPQGQILLDDVSRVNRAEGASTFEVATSKRTYYLTADSNSTMEEWIKVLQNVIRRNTNNIPINKDDHKPSIQGWVTKVKHGHSRKCWCSLVGRMFLYYKTPNDSKPLGQINMRDARVEEVLHVSDSDDEDPDDSMAKSEYTIGIFPNHQGPTYLIMPGKQELDAWLYHLTVVSCGDNLVGTQYEQLLARLMEVDGEENHVIWKHPLLLYSKESLTTPLTSLPSEQLQAEAIKLFKSIQLFISVPLDASGIDYHVALAQNALHQCLMQTELQNELLCQLMKQTARHSYHKPGVQQLLLCATQSLFLCDSSEKLSPTSTTSHDRIPPPESKLNPPPFVFVQSWQLLALALSLFVPKNRTLWYLRMHLARNADPKTESGKYAIFCQRTLERTLLNGGRESKPSRMEVLSILLKNPYHHSLPHSIPVHFLNGTYQVVGFDGSTTVEEFIQTVNEEAGIRDSSNSGFALFSDDPIDKSLEHCLQNTAKLCDVISKWEQALREKHLGKFESTKVVKLTYKNRLCFRQLLKAETDKERLLTAYQINEDVVSGKFPLSKELALELAVLMAQIEYGDYNGDKVRCSTGPTTPQQQMQCILERFYPSRYRDKNDEKQLLENIKEKWSSLRGRSVMDCVRIYLNCARRWSLCGAKLFSAKTQLKQGEPLNVWLAISEDSIVLLDFVTMQPLVRYPYGVVVTFGGCRDDFMLVVCQMTIDQKTSGEGIQVTERLLFSMPKPKILEITLLIADYMNALSRSGNMSSSLARLEKIRTSSKFRSSATPDTFPRGTHDGSAPYDANKAMSTSTELDNRRGAFCKKRAGSDCT
ncbi:uncharacterized protein CG43867 [Trichonephila inaurata madagascariensis]|uniref:Uncharacterized protein CG43867 n=1 Tax=Trichonephila inaurata madagascariensis TaxID=2747483 RepID=A0A8X6XJD8_9ARAC|nr:uncharacterized protein CG43867 [Trichonephila inaurata madagascariensis]